LRYDRIIRKSYLIVRTTLHSDGCFCDKCMKKSLIGRCGGIGVEQLKPKNIFYRLYLQLKPYVLLTILIVGCENEPLTDDNLQIEFNLNTQLDLDRNGFYHLKVNRNTFQTLHRISGDILTESGEGVDVVKFEWKSSHYWILGDTLGYIINRNFNDEGRYVSVDTSYVVGFEGFEVQTINCCSYSNSDGEVNTMLGVVKQMVGDTLTIDVSYYHPYTTELESQSFQIVLE